LQNASGVASGNIGHIEKGTRGVPRPRAVHDLAEAMKLSPEDRVLFFERAIGDLILEQVRNYAGYLYLALANSAGADQMERVLADNGLGVLADAAFDILLAIAQDEKYEQQRE
jgi:hypothetical protein